MKFNILKTRSGKLKHDLESKFLKKTINENDIQGIIDILRTYEKNNLETIEKLKKEKLYETKRINGALKQTIHAHGPITLNYIGSATKRIYGSLLDGQKDDKKYVKIDKGTLILFCVGLSILIGFLLTIIK